MEAHANSSYDERVCDTMIGEPSIRRIKCCNIDTEGANDPFTKSDNARDDSKSPFLASTEMAKSFNDLTKNRIHLNASQVVAPASHRGSSIESTTKASVTFAAMADAVFEFSASEKVGLFSLIMGVTLPSLLPSVVLDIEDGLNEACGDEGRD